MIASKPSSVTVERSASTLRKQRRLAPEALCLGALFLVALAVRLAGAGWGLPQLYEEATPLRVAWKLWAWGESHGFDGNPRTFSYPSLVFYLHFLGQALLFAGLRLAGTIHSALDFRVLYAIDKSAFVLVGRAISALFGAGLVPATYALTRRLAGKAAGWAAALLVAAAPVLVLRSTEIEVDLPLAFFATLGCVQALRLLDRPTTSNSVWAGVLTGLATSSKYPGLILIVPCAVAIALAPSASLIRPSTGPQVIADRRRRLSGRRQEVVSPRALSTSTRSARLRLVFVLLGIAALVFCVTSPYVLLDRAEFWRDIAKEREHMQHGHFGLGGGSAFLYYAGALSDRMLGWSLAACSLAGIAIHACWKRRAEAIVVASLPAFYLGLVGTWTMKADRYLLLLVPVGIAFATSAVAWGVARVRGATTRASAGVLWTLAVAGLGLPFAAQYMQGDLWERFRPDTRTQALRWVQQHVPEGSLIAAEQYAPDFANFTSPELMDEVAPRLRQIVRRPRFYAVQFVPMFQVLAERSAAFYDPALYRAADLFVVTSSVRARYETERSRYPTQCALYDSLERSWPRAAQFPNHGLAGPAITIFRNPDHAGWFASRREVPGPVGAGASQSGMENYFYWNFGVNYETGGHFDRAIESYRIALHYAPRASDAELYGSIATRLAYCLLRTRSTEATLSYLHDAELHASHEDELKVLTWVRRQVELDATQFAQLEIPRLGG
jgi:hypothetical protein